MIQLLTSEKLFPLWRTFPKLEAVFFAYAKRTQQGGARPAAFGEIMGFDVSYYQGSINCQVMKDYGARFIIPRAGYNIYKDSRYDEYMTGFAGLLPRSSYVFYHPETNPITQAEKMLQYMEPYKGQIKRVWGDMEYTWAGGYEAPKYWRVYRDTIKAQGYRWGWYTRMTWWNPRVTAADAAEFATDPVWAAQYSSALTLVPLGWQSAMIWQRGALPIGMEAGVSSPNLDTNYWNTEYSFTAEWGSTAPTPPTGGTMKQGILTATTTVLNVRNLPVSGSIISTVKTGDKVYGDIDAASGWLKVAYIIRAAGTREDFAAAYCSSNPLYITLTDYTPPAPVVETVDVQLPAGAVVIFKDATGKEIARYTA